MAKKKKQTKRLSIKLARPRLSGFTLIDVKAFRLAQGLNQTELAKKAGVSQSCICKVETYSDILVDNYSKIVQALGFQLTVSLKGNNK